MEIITHTSEQKSNVVAPVAENDVIVEIVSVAVATVDGVAVDTVGTVDVGFELEICIEVASKVRRL